MTGGAGDDQFEVATLHWNIAGEALLITDFASGEDTIRVKDIDANGALKGNGAFAFLSGEGDVFTGIAQLRWYVSGGATFIEFNSDFDVTNAELTIQLAGEHALSASDFIL